jgi:Raf kinase inhibitor-like YbhB/YbcL family protein
MKLASPAFGDNGKIPCKYTCDGENMSPPLIISNVPPEAESLVLIMDEPEPPKKGAVVDHWLVFDIPPGGQYVPEGEAPEGTHGTIAAGKVRYHGPCPSEGEHRYRFRLYALDVELPLPEETTRKEIERAMAGHVVARAEMTGRYELSLVCNI